MLHIVVASLETVHKAFKSVQFFPKRRRAAVLDRCIQTLNGCATVVFIGGHGRCEIDDPLHLDKERTTMKKSFKAFVVAASLSMVAGSVFAGTDLSSVTDVTLDFTGRNDGILAIALDVSTIPEDNVAFINQQGDGNFAMIDQSSAAGNVAAIMQDSSNNANSAYIAQVGAENRAIINQH